ncbi:hypothetical protein A3A66_02390 [Microgenomates group bacterium RIFCSPLOWO2_01_FULL_46_13]|nr:MAG: hypothetical protein A2783_00520 [Microgenomates group bacterium RIFCSPHIGHO2_01_FULL_45_11]OGV94822.1 MAG: hypothetical protein A3A66_02390 [Microgenomates group bacterium RIFCSPLOWO2_01_FULL_46_13]
MNLKKTPTIVYEDDYFLVLNKPPGWIVNRADSVKEATIQDWLKQTFSYSLSEDDNYRSGIVHRLDKDTSGLLLVAKTEDVWQGLTRQFHLRQVKKVYQALVHGRVSPASGYFTAPLGRSSLDRRRFTVIVSGRLSQTSYQVEKHFSRCRFYTQPVPQYAAGFSLLQLFPKTGRTHQLRVICRYLGYPIVADSLYLGKRLMALDRRWLSRLFLHAEKLSFTHPVTGRAVAFSLPLPPDLKAGLKYLE